MECHERIAECPEFRVDPFGFLKYRTAVAFFRDHSIDSGKFLQCLRTVHRPGIHLAAHHGERESVIFVKVDRLIIEPKRHPICLCYLAQQSEIAPEQGGIQLFRIIVARQTKRIIIERQYRRIDLFRVVVKVLCEKTVLPRVFRVVARNGHSKRELIGSGLFV